jgi:PAS domain S-box-containing protein
MSTDDNLNEQLLDLVSDSIMVNDLNGRFLYVNKTACKSRGYTKKELMNLSLHKLNTDEFSLESEKRLQQVLNTGVNVFESAHFRKDGSVMPVEVHAKVINYSNQKAVLSIVIDITERKQNEARLKNSELKQQSILNNIPDIAWMKDTNGKFVAVNKAMAKSVGSTVQDMIGKTDQDFYPADLAEKYIADDLKIIKSGQRKTIEETYFGSDKKMIWIETIKTPLFDGNGVITGTIGIARNITKRKQIEEILKEKGDFDARLLKNSSHPILVFNPDYSIKYVNPAFEALIGFSAAELIGAKPPYPYWPKQDAQRIMAEFRESVRNNNWPKEEKLISRKDGQPVWISITHTDVINDDGKVQYHLANWINISDLKYNEAALKRSEQRFRELADLLPAVATEVDNEGNITYVNKMAFDMFGYTKDELMKMRIFDLVVPEEYQMTFDRAQKMIEGEQLGPKEFTIVKKGGTRLSSLVQTAPIKNERGELIGSRGVMIDITTQKKIEQELRASEKIFRAFFEQTHDGIFLLDSQGRVIAWNAAHERLSGIKKEEMLGKHLWEYEGVIEPGQNRQILDTEIKRLLKTKQSPMLNTVTEFTIKTREGKITICLSMLILIETGNDFMIGSITRDITEIRKMEKDLRESEEKYRTLVENVRLGIIRTTPDEGGKLLECNKAAEEITGYSKDELRQMQVSKLYANSEDRSRFIEQIASTATPAIFDTHFKKKDGTVISVSIIAKAIKNKAGKILYIDGTFEDVTLRKLLEERIMNLYEKEKKHRVELQEEARARGMFIDVLAHELRTPLTPILVSSGMLNDFLSGKGGFEGKLTSNINNSAHVLSNRLEELLELARYSRGTFNLQQQIVNTAHFLNEVISDYKKSSVKNSCKISIVIAKDLPSIKMDKDRIEQVIVNLLSNACKFSPPDGTISFRARMRSRKLLIEVQDEGPGISAEEKLRIFQPYHRVEQDRLKFPGLGLGLAVAKQIIEAHGGKIWVVSQLNRGSTFCFDLPVNPE